MQRKHIRGRGGRNQEVCQVWRAVPQRLVLTYIYCLKVLLYCQTNVVYEFTRGEAVYKNECMPDLPWLQNLSLFLLCLNIQTQSYFTAESFIQSVLNLNHHRLSTCHQMQFAHKTDFCIFFPVCNGLGTSDLTKTRCVNATNIESFRNCTKINGNICFIHTSIHG